MKKARKSIFLLILLKKVPDERWVHGRMIRVQKRLAGTINIEY